jgi:hypothetical protein
MKQTKQQKRNQLVLERLIAFSNEDNHNAKSIGYALDEMLDDLCMDDFFGTETQCDPRGDGRDGPWGMLKRVEGIDK